MRGFGFAWAIAAFALCGIVATPIRAGVSTTGDTYDDGSSFYAGYQLNTTGGLTIDGGGVFNRSYGYLGYNLGSAGAVTVTGAGSKWTNSDILYVGVRGNGTLRVEAGGEVSGDIAYLGHESGTTGAAIITGAGSKWSNSGTLFVGYSGSGTLTVSDGGLVSAYALYASLSDLYGDGTIMVQGGAYLDGDLIFDATHGAGQTATFGTGGTLELAMNGTGTLSIGYKRSSSLRIADGRSVASGIGFLGGGHGLTGMAVITGAGSKWTNSFNLSVGSYGTGTLRVEAGGQVSNSYGYLGYTSGSTGTAVITGAGSKWANSTALYVGEYGKGTLTVSDGGQVTATNLSINNRSIVRLHVSGDRMLVLGNASTAGSINNGGRLSLLADAFLPAGIYRPIGEYADRALAASGSTPAVGGVWDTSANTFTVTDPTFVDSGTPAEVAGGARLIVSDPRSGDRAGVSFGTLSAITALTSLPMTESEWADLVPLLLPKETMLSAWDFVGQLVGDEALVSFEVGTGAEGLRVWRLSQNGWSEYTPEMMTYDAKGIVSFTVDPASLNSGGYALTVPEPAGLGLLAIAAIALLNRRRLRPAKRG